MYPTRTQAGIQPATFSYCSLVPRLYIATDLTAGLKPQCGNEAVITAGQIAVSRCILSPIPTPGKLCEEDYIRLQEIIVPVVVGGVLSLLLILILVAYVVAYIHRKRKEKNSQYETVDN